MFLVRTHPVARGIKIGSNQPPQWQSVPAPSFVLGVASNYPPTGTYQSNGYVTDADGNTITLTWISGSITGVTWDGGKFVYNGAGSVGTTGSLVLRASDGTDHADSSAFSIEIVSNLAWSGTPSVSFVEAGVTPVNLGSYVTNYNASTDEFRVTPSYSLPLWLSLTAGPGTGSGNLTPNGNQVDADDVSASPGIKIDVRRSGGAWVSSAAFGVTVTAAPVATGTIEDFAFEGVWDIPWTDPQMGVTGGFWTGKHTAFRECPADGKIYGFGGDGTYPGCVVSVQDGNIHYPRFTFGANLTPTFDIYYPWMGKAGKDFPIAADDHSFTWDSNRNCFWCIGGYSSGPLLGTTYAGRTVVGNPLRAGQYLWRYFPSTEEWENLGLLSSVAPNFAQYGQGAAYVPAIDCLVRSNGNGHRMYWYNCATGATGFHDNDLATESVDQGGFPCIYDSGNNEIIYVDLFGQTNAVWACKLDRLFDANPFNYMQTRVLIPQLNSVGAQGQTPLWIRNRILYASFYPLYTKHLRALTGGSVSGSSDSGNGLGMWAVTLDTPTPQVSKGSNVMANNLLPTASGNPQFTFNEGAYSAMHDAVLGTSIQDSGVYVFRYDAPSWTPSAGDVKALTTDWRGSSAHNTFLTVYQGNTTQFGSGPASWMSGAYCRDMSMNGMFLCQGGGDADYFGNEVYGFDFDSRRWYRLSNRCTSLRGGSFRGSDDALLPTTDPNYFNLSLCEHGPLVADGALTNGGTNWGLLPMDANGLQATQPGVPHMYDGAVWVPGSWIGNERGAFVRPYSKFVYGPGPTSNRAHYFDLDRMKWGRLTTNAAGSQSYLTQCAIDETNGIIYWQNGYVNLADKSQNSANWWGADPPYDRAMEFDPVRGILLCPGDTGTLKAVNLGSPGATLTPATSGANPWGSGVFGGIVYCSDLDCFFYYNANIEGAQVIWKIEAPSGSRASDSGTLATKRVIALAGTWTRSKITMGGTSISGSALTYGNIAYVKKLKCVAIHIPGGYMYLYRPVGL